MSDDGERLARDAGDEENSVPGTHGPASAKSRHIMAALLDTVREVYPGVQVAMFVFEPETGRYNYAATVERADMVAVLRGFLARQDEMEGIDRAVSRPPEGSA